MESKTLEAANWASMRIAQFIKENKVDFPLRALGPAPCTLEVINGRYRYRLILKAKNTRMFRQMISRVLIDFGSNSQFKAVRVFADINGDIGL